jgi:transcriptional regulator with XRE-family HTH domain
MSVMATDHGPAVNGAQLRGELTRLRRASGFTQQQIAEELQWSSSKLIRLEGGHSGITRVDLDALLSRYGITSTDELKRLHELHAASREPAWWDDYRDSIALTYLNYVGFEAGAASIRQFQIGFIPGLLQTGEYAQAVTAIGNVDPENVPKIAGLRLRRQAELAKRSARPRQSFVIDEGVIRRHVGISKDRAIMPTQLRAIADRAERDEMLTVRVIPFDAGEHPGQFGSFTLLEFEGDVADVLYLDSGRGLINMIDAEDSQMAEYADDFDELLDLALTGEKSIEFIRSVAQEMS